MSEPKKPIIMSVPRKSGKAEYLALVAAIANIALIKVENK